MNDVSLFVQHDVAIVPVFNLEQEQEQTVGSHAADEIIAGLYKQQVKSEKLTEFYNSPSGDERNKQSFFSSIHD